MPSNQQKLTEKKNQKKKLARICKAIYRKRTLNSYLNMR